MFVELNSELASLNRMYAKRGFQMVAVYGRRRSRFFAPSIQPRRAPMRVRCFSSLCDLVRFLCGAPAC